MLLDSVRLTFDCVDPALLGHFWSAVTGYRVVTNEAAIVRLEGRALRVGELVFREVDRWKAAPNRLQLDLLTDDLEGETARLVALGASPAGMVDAEGEQRVLAGEPREPGVGQLPAWAGERARECSLGASVVVNLHGEAIARRPQREVEGHIDVAERRNIEMLRHAQPEGPLSSVI